MCWLLEVEIVAFKSIPYYITSWPFGEFERLLVIGDYPCKMSTSWCQLRFMLLAVFFFAVVHKDIHQIISSMIWVLVGWVSNDPCYPGGVQFRYTPYHPYHPYMVYVPTFG